MAENVLPTLLLRANEGGSGGGGGGCCSCPNDDETTGGCGEGGCGASCVCGRSSRMPTWSSLPLRDALGRGVLAGLSTDVALMSFASPRRPEPEPTVDRFINEGDRQSVLGLEGGKAAVIAGLFGDAVDSCLLRRSSCDLTGGRGEVFGGTTRRLDMKWTLRAWKP